VSRENDAEPAAAANGPARPWLSSNVGLRKESFHPRAKMKKLLLLLGFVLSLRSLTAGIITDIAVVSPAEILTGKAPMTCEVQRRKDGSVSLKFERPF
jgi:hypothetical protein